VLAEKSVSARHLKIEYKNGSYYLETIANELGTIINGRPLLKRVQMVQGDEIAVGEISMLFVNHAREPVSMSSAGDEIEVIDEDYLDKKFINSAFSLPSAGKVAVNGEAAAAKVDGPDAEEYFALEPTPDDLETPPQTEPKPPLVGKNGAAPSYQLTAIYGPYTGKTFSLNAGDTRIGRDNSLNDIVIRLNDKGALDPSISRRHATISCKNGRFYITDKRSKTRTYVNQIKLSTEDEIPIAEGDEIEIVSDQKSTIFRLTSAANPDFSPPRKAGVWWMRNAHRLGTLLTIATGLLAVGALGLGSMNRIAANKKPGELKFIEETWHQYSGGRSQAPNANPNLPASAGLRSSLALGDLNGDDKPDVIFTDRQQNLIALDGVAKKILWMNEQIGVQNAIPIVLVDLNANGQLDVLVVGRDSRLRALDGVNGAEIWLSPILGEIISGAPVAADLNGDGLRDVVVCTAAGQIHIGIAYINEMDWKTIDSGVKILSAPSAADGNGDGRSEVFIGSEEGQLIVLEGSGIAKVLDLKEELSKATGSPIHNFEIRQPAAIADLNGNGALDLVVGGVNGWYLALESGSFSRLWHEQIEPEGAGAWAAPAAGKFDDDQLEDVALASRHFVKVIKGAADPQNRKSALWQTNFGLNEIVAPLTPVDFNKDGVHDLVVALSNGATAIVNGRDGKILSEIKKPDNPAVSAALAGDIGSDGYLNVFLIRRDLNVYKIQTNSTIAKNSVIWGQAFGNERNSCRYEFVRPQSRVYDVTLSISSALFLGAITVISISRKKRERIIKANQRS
jgi:pSer/pThr/pTyr-binding forkhead associated (FHA) protein